MQKLFLPLLLITILSACNTTPKRPLAFFNNSEKILTVSIKNDSSTVFEKNIQPFSNVFGNIPIGKYTVKTSDAEGNVVNQVKEFTLKKETARETTGYICIDVEGKTPYVLVRSSYLYTANNSLTQAIVDAGEMEKNKIIGAFFKPPTPFFIQFRPVFPYEALPLKIDALSAGYVLVPLKNNLKTKEEIYSYINEYFNKVGFTKN